MSRIVAIHQPNYLPWMGYFYKMLNCDIFVLGDTVQYTKGSYINRNLIKMPDGNRTKWLSVSVLTKRRHGQPINEVKINNQLNWNLGHWNSIKQSYTRSPYFKLYEEELKATYQKQWDNLSQLNETLILTCKNALNINNVELIKASSLSEAENLTGIIDICRAVGADTYLSGYGGAKYIDEQEFKRSGITLKYYDFEHPQYHQLLGNFISNLSIIDLLFNEGNKSLSILTKAHK